MSSGPAKENENTECRARRMPAGFRVLPGRGSTKTGASGFGPGGTAARIFPQAASPTAWPPGC